MREAFMSTIAVYSKDMTLSEHTGQSLPPGSRTL